MCGIFGIIGTYSDSKLEQNLINMAKILKHRGPDDEGFHIEKNKCAGIGMTRLSIVDRKCGHQPIYNEDKSLVIVFNGEIYNYKELRDELIVKGHIFQTDTDTEVVLHLFEEYREDCFIRLNGMFAVAIFDRNKKEVFLARDRFGVKPLLYTNFNGFIFASESKAFLTISDFPDELSHQAICDYFSYWYVPAPLSIYKNVKKLMPAHWMKVNDKGEIIKIERYWKAKYSENNKSYNELKEEYFFYLNQTVHRQLIGEVPIGVFLSGGMDSSSIAYHLAEKGRLNYKTFSIGFEGIDFDETPLINQVVKKFNCDHVHTYVTGDQIQPLIEEVTYGLDEPLGITAYPYYILCKVASQHVTVALTGDGGDEQLGGYDTYYGHKLLQIYRRVPSVLRRSLFNLMIKMTPVSYSKRGLDVKLRKFMEAGEYSPERGHVSWREIFNPEEKKILLDLNDIEYDPYHAFKDFIEEKDIKNIVNRFMYADLSIFLPEACFFLADRIGMHHSMELRVPFMDNDLFDFTASLPLKWKVKGMTTKVLIRKIMKDIMPDKILTAPKFGFAPPFGRWIKGPLKEYFYDLLTEINIGQTGIINVKEARNVLDEHIKGVHDNTRKLMLLFGFGNWYNVYRKNKGNISL